MFSCNNISKKYRDKEVLKNISFCLKEGDRIRVEGESGSGKTTLLNILSGMESPDSGDVLLDEVPVKDFTRLRKESLCYVPCGNCLVEHLTVRENLGLIDNREMNRDTTHLFEELGIFDLMGKYPSQISSGEYKRVCIARAAISRAPYVLLDEPTSNLDAKNAEIITRTIEKFFSDKGVVVATHDPRIHGNSVIRIGD